MSNIYTFEEMNLIGRWAEEQALTYFEEAGYHPVDVSGLRQYQVRDIDIALVSKKEPGCNVFVEVKGDRYSSGNVYIETEYNDGPGYIVFSQADYLFYYFVRQGRALLIPMADLRGWFEVHKRLYRTAGPRTPSRGKLAPSLGYIVPEADVIQGVPGVVEIAGLPVMEGS